MTKVKKELYNIDTCGQFHKHFTLVTHSYFKISCIKNCMHAPMQCFQNALAYFPTTISYPYKMFLKLTPEPNVVKLFTVVIYECLL